MTIVTVDPGVCGFPAVIEVEAVSASRAKVRVKSDCEKAVEAGEALKEVDFFELFKREGDTYSVYRDTVFAMDHITCPIPVAIMKGVEAELGMAVPKDVSMRIDKGRS